MNENNVMKYEPILPEDFDGTFQFTNWTDEDFIGVWGGKQYTYKAKSRSPMIMAEHTPLEIQSIRKKFAKDLAEQQFFKSKAYESFIKQEKNADGSPRLNSIQMAGTYTLNELAPYIQRCLEPLDIVRAQVQDAPKVNIEDKLTRNEDGELNSEAIDKKVSLKDKALKA